VSDLDHIRRRLDALIIGTGAGIRDVVIINEGGRAYPGGPIVLRFVNARGQRHTVVSVGDEELAAFLDRVVPAQCDLGYRLAIIGGLPIEPQ
jgi:hypothetical protein